MRADAVVARVIQHVDEGYQHSDAHAAALSGRAKGPGVHDLQRAAAAN